MRLFTSLVLLLIFSFASGQEITVLDKNTKKPIFNVAVFNKDKSKNLLTRI